MERFREGRRAYQEGRYREAARALEQALDLDPGSPTLLYNLSRVFELMGELERAISFAARYRRLLPAEAEEERARIDETLVRLRGARDWLVLREQAEAGQRIALREIGTQTIVSERGVADGFVWGSLAGSAGAFAVAAVVGGLAMARSNDADGVVNGVAFRDDDARRDRLRREARRLGRSADAFFGVGGALLLSAGLLYLLRSESHAQTGDVSLALGAGHLALRGAF